LLAGVGVAGVLAFQNFEETKDAVTDNIAWAAPALVATEAMWNIGATTMLISTGRRVGNPLKLHSRFKEIVTEASDSAAFKAGLGINILGEVGTASILIGGSVAELPPSTWPLTVGSSVALVAPGVVVWKMLWDIHKDKQANSASKEAQNVADISGFNPKDGQ
jgi:hypothetical protein